MAGVTELFRLSARLVLDTDGFDAGIASAKKQVQGMGGAFAGAESNVTKLSSAMNVAKGIAGAAGAALKKGFDIGKEIIQTSAGIKALDESMAVTFEGIEERAAAAFKAVSEENNIAERRLQESGLAFFRQFSGAGMDSANAMMNMENALQLAADAAAAYDISLEDASSMIRSFVRGNVEAGESIGVFVNEQKRNELALEEYGKKWQDLTEAERQFLLLDLVEQTYKQNKVLGQGAREASNYTNIVGNLVKAWEGARGKTGEKALPKVTEALQGITDWITNNPLVFETIGTWFGDVAGAASDAAIGVLDFTSAFLSVPKDEKISWLIDQAFGEGSTKKINDTVDSIKAATNLLTNPAGVPANSTEATLALALGTQNAVFSSNPDSPFIFTPPTIPKSALAAEEYEIRMQELDEGLAKITDEQAGLLDEISTIAEKGMAPIATFLEGFSSGQGYDETWMRRRVQEKTHTKEAWIPQLPMDGKNLYIPWEPPQVEVEGDLSDDTPALMQAELDRGTPLKTRVYGVWSGFFGQGGPGLADTTFFDDNYGGVGQYASGLDRVPFDGFPAFLDRGESVLNRVEAEDWRAAKRGENMGFDPAAVGDAVKAALAGVSISMDGRTVGALVTPYVSREQAAEAWRRR